jgi:rSAM/selenodomain-associated transferase 2
MGVDFSIIIPVYNEEKTINETISSIRAINNNFNIEIIAVDGNPEQNTLNSITDSSVLKVSSLPGRGLQLDMGAAESKGNILVFLHADTILPKKAFEKIYDAVDKKGFKAGCFDLEIESKKFIFKIISRISSARSRFTRIPYGDQVHFFERKFFFDILMYPEIPVMEDVAMMKKIKRLGKKILIIRDKAKTSSRRWDEEGIVFCTLRNWLISFLYAAGIPAEKLEKFYRRNR